MNFGSGNNYSRGLGIGACVEMSHKHEKWVLVPGTESKQLRMCTCADTYARACVQIHKHVCTRAGTQAHMYAHRRMCTCADTGVIVCMHTGTQACVYTHRYRLEAENMAGGLAGGPPCTG